MRTLILCAVAALTAGCAGTFRSAGMQDPTVEAVRALAASQASAIKALTEALTKAQATACEVR